MATNNSSILIDLPSRTDNQGEVAFEIIPLEFNFNSPIKFEVKIETHSGSLDFDLTQISILEDDKGNEYQPLEWQGSGPGGHHISGILVFPKLNAPATKLKLTIQDNFLRIFEWNSE